MKNLKKYLTLFSVALLLSVSAVSAQTFVTCQKKIATSKGYYNANCSGNYLKCNCYYEDSSENYTVMNYIGVNGNDYTYSVGCHSGKRSASISKNMGKPYNQVAHTHSFTVNRN